MRVQLFSPDSDLQRLCREVLGQLQDEQWELVTPETAAGAVPDLCIWDFHPGTVMPEPLRAVAKHLFVVDRKELGALSKALPVAPLGILLKPVAHSALSAFIELAVKREPWAPAGEDAFAASRDEMLQCLLQANLRLQEYDHDRTNFLARAAHDFRAPLTAINGYCGLMLNELLGPLNAEQKDVLQRMQHSLKRLSRMATAMFELSIGGQVERRITFQKADLEVTVDQVLHEIGPLANEKQISVAVDLERPPDGLYFEPSQMEQVLINLLDNACRFTPKCGSIEIAGYTYFWDRRCRNVTANGAPVDRRRHESQVPNCYRIDVRDSGPGIPVHHLRTIFEEYASFGDSSDRSGGGLGLAICKAIMEAHHGRVWAESGPDGAVFSLLLPFRHPEAATAARVTGTSDGIYAKAV